MTHAAVGVHVWQFGMARLANVAAGQSGALGSRLRGNDGSTATGRKLFVSLETVTPVQARIQASHMHPRRTKRQAPAGACLTDQLNPISA